MANTNEKKRRPTHTTMKAEVLWCHVVEPDSGNDKIKKEPQFNITLRLSDKNKEKLMAMLANELDEAQENMQIEFDALSPINKKKLGKPEFNDPVRPDYNQDGEETGDWLITFKTKATYEDKNGNTKERKVPLFDCMGKPVELDNDLGFGSVAKVNFTAVPYFVQATGKAGLTLYLNAVQILKLMERGTRSAADFGFGEEDVEDGFSADDVDNLKAQGTGAGLIDDDEADEEAPKPKRKTRKADPEDALPEDF